MVWEKPVISGFSHAACYTSSVKMARNCIELTSSATISIGIVADTHIPDRVNELHPKLLEEFKKRDVDYIFHCGDLSSPKVVDTLSAIAPFYAVRGNRDLLLYRKLPTIMIFKVNGTRVLLTHGYLTPSNYWKDKVRNYLYGYELDRYIDRLVDFEPEAKIIIFGHSHHAENTWENGRLFFNPGSSSVGSPPDYQPSFGIMRLQPDGGVESEINPLRGAVVKCRKWMTGEETKFDFFANS